MRLTREEQREVVRERVRHRVGDDQAPTEGVDFPERWAVTEG
ncbi:hypothetical protein [Streptomyces chryseus]|nr:hypothetical protein [Streptomyces chryseus]